MTNYFLYQFCNFILNESESGNAITPEDFTSLLRVSSLEMTRQIFKNYEEEQEMTDAIDMFKNMEHLTFTNGWAWLPDNYYRKSFMFALGDEVNGEVEKVWVDFCTDYEWGLRQTEYLMAPTLKHPIARLAGWQVQIRPIEITDALFYYLQKPYDPVFDYYYNANGRIVFFPEGTHTLQAGEIGRQGEVAGDVIASQNRDLDWNENEQLIIVGMICSKAGVNLKEGQVIEYSELYKQQTS